MRDTVNAAVWEARRPKATETLRDGFKHRVRVPGALVGACKVAGADVEPCILVESFFLLHGKEVLHDRVLCREVMFHGETRMVQSVESPCGVTGAILWLETTGPLTCHNREA